MGLSVDPRKIARIWVTPWEIDERLYGVSYETTDGHQAADRIGTKAEAEAVVRRVVARRAGLSPMARKPLRCRWSPEDTALLAKLLREGKDYRQIARKMHRSDRT